MKYKVTNYRYGLPKGTIIDESKIDKDRLRFLEPVKELKKPSKSKVNMEEKE